MQLGPIEMLIIKFPGNEFTGDLLPALTELVENGTVHVVDLMLLKKDSEGNISLIEVTDLTPDVSGPLAPLLTDVTQMLSDEDAYELGAMLENDSSAGVLLFENTWATRFAQAVRAAKGEVLLNERLPHVVVEELLAAAQQGASA
jgi:hypothetical protein